MTSTERLRIPRIIASSAAPLLAAVLLAAAPAAAAPITFRTVALTGQTAPGTGGDTFDTVDYGGTVNDAGQTAFIGDLTGSGNIGIWSEGGGSLANVAQEGGTAPGSGGATYTDFSTPIINESGKVGFSAALSTGGYGIYSNASGSVAKIAQEGDTAPGGIGQFSSIDVGPFNNAGRTAFTAGLDSGGEGLFSDRTGSLATVAATGDTAPGTSGDTFDTFTYEYPALNDSGTIAFWSGLTSGNEGIWRDNGSTQTKVASSGDAAAGTANTFTSFYVPDINNAGQVAFVGDINDVAGSEGIWVDTGGTQTKIALSGETAAGTSQTFDSMDYPLLNGNGDVAFGAYLADGNYGVWSNGLSGMHKVAVEGDAAPDAGGALFSYIDSPSFNIGGQVAFGADLSDGSSGVWAEDPYGVLTKILNSGDSLDVAPGDTRTVSAAYLFGLSGNQDGFPSALSENNDMLVLADFEDGSSGVFVANFGQAVATPAPDAGLTLLAGLGAIGLLRRRQRQTAPAA